MEVYFDIFSLLNTTKLVNLVPRERKISRLVEQSIKRRQQVTQHEYGSVLKNVANKMNHVASDTACAYNPELNRGS